MTMTIVGVKNFKSLKKAYDLTGLSIYSATKIDILKNLVILAEKREELKELEDIIEHFKKYYRLDENNYEIKKKIKESILLFEDKKNNLNNNRNNSENDKNNNIIIVKEGFDFSKLDNINKPKELSDIDDDLLNEAEEIINNFLKTPNKREKGLFIKKFLTLNLSFNDLFYLHEKYYQQKNKIVKIIFEKMFKKAKTKEDWVKLYKISKPKNKNYQIIKKNAEIKNESREELKFIDTINNNIVDNNNITDNNILDNNYWVKEFFKDKNKIRKSDCLARLKKADISFEEALEIYKKSNGSYKLRNTILQKMNEKAETFEEKLTIYNLTGLKFLGGKKTKEKLISDLTLLVNTPENFKKAEKVIPKTSHFWYYILKKKIEEN